MLGHGGVAPVPGTAHVGGDALSLMEDLDGAVRDPDPERLFGQGVGHRVIVLGGLDMVIETGAALLPFGVLVGLARQPLQRRLVERRRTIAGGTRRDALSGARCLAAQQFPLRAGGEISQQNDVLVDQNSDQILDNAKQFVVAISKIRPHG